MMILMIVVIVTMRLIVITITIGEPHEQLPAGQEL